MSKIDKYEKYQKYIDIQDTMIKKLQEKLDQKQKVIESCLEQYKVLHEKFNQREEEYVKHNEKINKVIKDVCILYDQELAKNSKQAPILNQVYDPKCKLNQLIDEEQE